MKPWDIHPAQITILRTLRREKISNYSTMQHQAGLDSDVFKFHVRKLVEVGLIAKQDDGRYILTIDGKEFANSIDEKSRHLRKQPKLSMLFIITRENNGKTEYLLHQRKRQPYYGYWGLMSGPVRWGVSIEQCAHDEILKQTGLESNPTVIGMLRQRDFKRDSDMILEDKLFTLLMVNIDLSQIFSNGWSGGTSKWMTKDAIQNLDPAFATTKWYLEQKHVENFSTLDMYYDPEVY